LVVALERDLGVEADAIAPHRGDGQRLLATAVATVASRLLRSPATSIRSQLSAWPT